MTTAPIFTSFGSQPLSSSSMVPPYNTKLNCPSINYGNINFPSFDWIMVISKKNWQNFFVGKLIEPTIFYSEQKFGKWHHCLSINNGAQNDNWRNKYIGGGSTALIGNGVKSKQQNWIMGATSQMNELNSHGIVPEVVLQCFTNRNRGCNRPHSRKNGWRNLLHWDEWGVLWFFGVLCWANH